MSRIVLLGVAVRAKEHALRRFQEDLLPGSIGQGPRIQRKRLRRWVDVVELKRSEVPPVAAATARTSHELHQALLVPQGTRALTHVVLMTMVQVAILAAAPTESGLPAAQRLAADLAA